MSDHKGARLMLDVLPPASSLIGDKGYDSNWFRKALADRGIEPCIPPTKSRKRPIDYDKALYRQRHRIENMFGRLKAGAASPPAMTGAPGWRAPTPPVSSPVGDPITHSRADA